MKYIAKCEFVGLNKVGYVIYAMQEMREKLEKVYSPEHIYALIERSGDSSAVIKFFILEDK